MRSIISLLLILVYLSAQSQVKDSLSGEFQDNFEVISLNINTGNNEMQPFLYGKTLYFSSSGRQSTGITYSDPDGQSNFYDVYTSERIDSIRFSKPLYSGKWSTVFNDGTVAFNSENSTVLYSSNQKDFGFLVRSSKVQQNLRLYYSLNNKGKWSKPEMLPFCTGPYSYCSGAFYKNNTVVFASDMPGGKGGMDLYITEYRNHSWSEPKNLGGRINTSGNELFPFVNESGILYFSSERKGGFGGLDIYSLSLEDLDVAVPFLLERPINSPGDDFGVWTDSLGLTGYLSSDRSGEKNDDIFYFYKILPEFKKEIIPQTKFCYTFFEESSTIAADTVGLQYEWDFGSGIKRKGREVDHCFKKPGIYPVQLNVIDRSSGELIYNDLSYDFIVEEPKQLNIISADSVRAGEALLLNSSTSVIAGYSIKKHYWAFDDGWFAIGTDVRHKYFKKGTYNVKLGVLAVNDTTGKESTFYSIKKIVVLEKSKSTGYFDTKPQEDKAPIFYRKRYIEYAVSFFKPGNDQ
ncbi:MAG TPA: PKD domain-containing protein [Bacteroidia bacterium]